ncbi:hypothetical protein BGZ97_005633, partial [Linnemannia gamsii]
MSSVELSNAWTSGHNKRKYLGITFHYVIREYRLSTVVIGMERMLAVKVTAENLESAIKKVIGQWSLQGKVVGLTSDQGSNIKKCLRDQEEQLDAHWIPCVSHQIQESVIKRRWTIHQRIARSGNSAAIPPAHNVPPADGVLPVNGSPPADGTPPADNAPAYGAFPANG